MQNCSAQQALRLVRIAGMPDQVVSSRILSEAYGRIHIDLQFIDVPAKRATAMIVMGEFDGGLSKDWEAIQANKSVVPVPPAINFLEPTGFTRFRETISAGWRETWPYTVGIVRGDSCAENATYGMEQLEREDNLDSLLGMLDAGRMEMAVTDLFDGVIRSKALKFDQKIRPQLPPLNRVEIYHFLSARHQALVPAVEKNIAGNAGIRRVGAVATALSK